MDCCSFLFLDPKYAVWFCLWFPSLYLYKSLLFPVNNPYAQLRLKMKRGNSFIYIANPSNCGLIFSECIDLCCSSETITKSSHLSWFPLVPQRTVSSCPAATIFPGQVKAVDPAKPRLLWDFSTAFLLLFASHLAHLFLALPLPPPSLCGFPYSLTAWRATVIFHRASSLPAFPLSTDILI